MVEERCSVALQKIKLGVPGLDEILKGGVLENSKVLVSGGPGTGKSILVMQFLVEGARNGEPSLCILYDRGEDFLSYADALGIPLRDYVKKGKIILLQEKLLPRKIASVSTHMELIRRHNIRRVALDSLTMFSYINVSDDRDYRRKIVDFLGSMRNVTLVATSEAMEYNIDGTAFRPEDFLFDGLIFLTKVRQESTFERVLHVGKMRGQEHQLNIYPFLIGKGGVTAYPGQLPFSLMEERKMTQKAKK